MGFPGRVLAIAFMAWLLVRILEINKNLRIMGFGIPVFNHAPGPCKIFHVNGSEDIDVLPNGIAIFSSGLKSPRVQKTLDPSVYSRKPILYALDLNNPEKEPKALTLENFDDSNFIPFGIDLYTEPTTNEVYLFVVNRQENVSIEIFKFDQEHMVLKHRKTVVDRSIYSPNDVVAVGTESFYTTNDRYFENIFLAMIESFYPLKLGNVAFYNGSVAKIVADQFHFANGINIDKSGKYIFVISNFAGEVVIYERMNENELEELQTISAGVGLDNIFVDEMGDLWIGVVNLAVLSHFANFSKPAPGKAIQVKLSRSGNSEVPYNVDDIREAFSTSGDGELKGISAAAYYQGKLLLGSPFSNLMCCEVVAL